MREDYNSNYYRADDDFRAIVSKVHPGCRLTIISDSCHSGGLIENAEEQIGDSTAEVVEEAEESPQEREFVKQKFIPISQIINFYQGKTGKEEISKEEIYGELTLAVSQFVQRFFDGSEEFDEVNAGGDKRGLPDNGVLISGCQTYQTSADDSLTGDPSDYFGALTNAIMTVLEATEGEISNRDLVNAATEVLVEQGYEQRPGLYCSDELADAPFIC